MHFLFSGRQNPLLTSSMTDTKCVIEFDEFKSFSLIYNRYAICSKTFFFFKILSSKNFDIFHIFFTLPFPTTYFYTCTHLSILILSYKEHNAILNINSELIPLSAIAS